MPVLSGPNELPWLGGEKGDLLSQASAVLAREAKRLPSISLGMPSHSLAAPTPGIPGLPAIPVDLGGRVCPVTGAVVALPGADKDRLRQQAHELLAGLMTAFGQISGGVGILGGFTPTSGDVPSLTGRKCPVTKATIPIGGVALDDLRQQAHGFIETLLVTFNDTTGEKGLPTEDKVPQLQCAAPVQAGSEARAILSVGNEEAAPSDVALYCTNFVADSGHEIPSLRVTVSPRRATIPARTEAIFEIKIAVSQQTPTGIYSGLIQAMGSKYVKAVLSVEVL